MDEWVKNDKFRHFLGENAIFLPISNTQGLATI